MIEESGGKLVATALLAGVAAALDNYGSTVIYATCGAFWALTGADTATKKEGAAAMFRWVLIGVLFTEVAVALVTKHVGLPAGIVQGPVAFLLAFGGDRWREVPSLISRALSRFLPDQKQP